MAEDQYVPLEGTSDHQTLTAEYRDGQLQIVEVARIKDGIHHEVETTTEQILTDLDATQHIQLMGVNKDIVQLDYLNLTLVKSEDGEHSYRLVSNTEGTELDEAVACVFQSSDAEEITVSEHEADSYVVTDGEDGQPVVFLKSSLKRIHADAGKVEEKPPENPTPVQLLAKVKALKKAKELLTKATTKQRGNKKSNFPPPHELLASPKFKLYLYSCKSCSFKCNAIKELSAHRSKEHSNNKYKPRLHSMNSYSTSQAAAKKLKGIEECLNSPEAAAADILVCGACGFECSDRAMFSDHIASVHA